jgi:mersacidin/lichenicidin family type 2 lantibiotic
MFVSIQERKKTMSNETIIRAWKDEAFRESLSEAERALLPEHPVGLIDLADAELEQVAGGLRSAWHTAGSGQLNCCA